MTGATPDVEVKVGYDDAEVRKGADRTGASLDRMAKVAKRAAAGIATAYVAANAAVVASMAAVLSEGDKYAKTAQKIGIAVEELQKLNYTAKLSGTSMEDLAIAVQTVSRNMANLAAGQGGEAGRAFAALGISVKDTSGRMKDASTIINEVADKFSTMRDGVNKTALAMLMFGESGAKMIPMLNQGSAAIEATKMEAQKLGAVMSKDATQAAERFNDAVSKLATAGFGVLVQAGEAVLPIMANMAESLVNFVKTSQIGITVGKALGSMVANFGKIAQEAAPWLAILFGPAVLAGATALVGVVGTGLVGAFVALSAVIRANPIAIAFQAAAAAAYYFRDSIKKAVGVDVVQTAKNAANGVINSFRAAFEDVKFVWNNFPDIMRAAAIGALNAYVRHVNMMVRFSKQAFNWIAEAANSILPEAMKINPFDVSSDAIAEMSNPYAKKLEEPLRAHAKRIGAIMGTDMLTGFSSTAPKIAEAAKSITKGDAPGLGADPAQEAAKLKALQEKLKMRLEMIRTSLMSEEQLENARYAKSMEALTQSLEQKLISEQEYQALREGLEKKHQDKIQQLRDAGNRALLDSTSEVMGAVSGLLQSYGDKHIKVIKGLAIAQALIAAWTGAAEALKMPFPYNLAAFASVLAKGISAVTAIKSIKPSGNGGGASGGGGGGAGGGGGSGGGGSRSAATPDAGSAGSIRIEGIEPGKLYSGSRLEELMDAMFQKQKDGYQLIYVK